MLRGPMPSPDQIVDEFLKRAAIGWDLEALTRLSTILKDAAGRADNVFHPAYGTEGPAEGSALLMIDSEGVTLYRVGEHALERLSYGRLTNGIVTETQEIPVGPSGAAHAGRHDLAYSNPRLVPFGGSLRFELQELTGDERSQLRAVLLPMTGQPTG